MPMNLFYFEIFFLREQFLCDHSILKNPISKMFHNFSLKLNMAKHRHDFVISLSAQTEEQIKLAKTEIKCGS